MVLRYALKPSSPYRPKIYLRSTSAKGAVGENTAALGLSVRPLPRFPVIAAIEGRLTDQDGKRRYQPVAMAVTELPPFPLPLGLRGEAYAQAGYVAGRFATPFADGQFRADRALFQLGSAHGRLGGGPWAGGQKGASRFDAGPLPPPCRCRWVGGFTGARRWTGGSASPAMPGRDRAPRSRFPQVSDYPLPRSVSLR